MNTVSILDSFARGNTVTVTRHRRAGDDGHGRSVPDPAPVTITITARPRPATGRELLRLPELRRSTETRVFETTEKLYTSEQDGAYEADTVRIDDRDWEVQLVQLWPYSVADVPFYSVTVQAAR